MTLTSDDEDYFNEQELLDLLGWFLDDDRINDLGGGYEPDPQPF